MPAPKRLHPSSLNEWYGKKIRKLRIARGLSQEQLGELVRLSRSRIAQYELGTDVPPLDIVRLLDKVLEAGDDLIELWDYLTHGRDDRWAEKLVDAESQAKKIQHYTDTIPGLLQTREYATAMLRAGVPFFGGDPDEKVEIRMGRQDVLGGSNPPWIWSVLDESALYRTLGQPDVMRDQLLHLIKLGEQPRINVQVIPFGQDTLIAGIGLTSIFSLRDGRTVVYRQEPTDPKFITAPDDVEPFVALYDHLQAEALSPRASIGFIRQVVEEKYA
ncbi:Scr1 family TA system antitoxin-like transcriptional regulator [Streptomyces sp. NPDC001407]|uniref:helix-turn-helix domain-containing protein n=1 Tax=Streptomyces sp. NPDC001407 TaxID=3364573 RepID=UPI0036A4255D